MISSNIDLGQILVGTVIAIIGYFIKRELVTINNRIDRHDELIFNLSGILRELVGEAKITNWHNR